MNANDNNINLQEKIDSYILGKMTKEEKIVFESELANNMELKEKYELQKEIFDAVQKVRIKELLVGVETEIIEKRGKYNDGNSASIRKMWIGIAASILVIFFIGFEFYQSSVFKTYGNDYYAEIIAPSSRSDNKLDSLMNCIYTQIGEGEYSMAKANIEEAESIITSMKKARYETEEEQKYYDDILSIKSQEIDWYDAVLKMKQGKYHKAKKKLKIIASENGIYKDKVLKILNK